ncbi:MAG TPA: shikimate kinase AroL [Desulfopila sp.]|nr:shikimate kinase AroL [Desulfopila sp.]
MDDLIFLIGYRGVGKTTIGRKLAEFLGYAFVDTDALIVCRKRAAIAAIVAEEGWEEFRRLEKEVLNSLRDGGKKVVATGGGAVLHRQVWQQLRPRGTIFWLTAETESILQRLGADPATEHQRPSLTGQSIAEEAAAVMAERQPLYKCTAHYCVDTSNLGEDAVVSVIGDILER